MTTALATIFALGVLIFIHELGHFIMAKICRMRVERFSLGYPPRLAGKKIGDTDYCVSAIPFGGYVKISGMVDESLDTDNLDKPAQPWEFRAKPWYQRMLVIFAGSFMNIVFPYLVFLAAISINGAPVSPVRPLLYSVMPESPAAEAGLHPGDLIVSIDSQSISTWEDLTSIITASPGKELNIRWQRGDTVHSAHIIPEAVYADPDSSHQPIGRLGIQAYLEMERVSLFRSGALAFTQLAEITGLMLEGLYGLISGRESFENVAGPLGIAQMAGQQARRGFLDLISFMAFLSLNLAILNLLPIPVLDGGHILFLFIELIIRREIPLKVKLIIQQAGMALLLALMIFVFYNDILRIFR